MRFSRIATGVLATVLGCVSANTTAPSSAARSWERCTIAGDCKFVSVSPVLPECAAIDQILEDAPAVTGILGPRTLYQRDAYQVWLEASGAPLLDKAGGVVAIPFPPAQLGGKLQFDIVSSSTGEIIQRHGEDDPIAHFDAVTAEPMQLFIVNKGSGIMPWTIDYSSGRWITADNIYLGGCEPSGIQYQIRFPGRCGWKLDVSQGKDVETEDGVYNFALDQTQLWVSPSDDVAVFMTIYIGFMRIDDLPSPPAEAWQKEQYQDLIVIDYRVLGATGDHSELQRGAR